MPGTDPHSSSRLAALAVLALLLLEICAATIVALYPASNLVELVQFNPYHVALFSFYDSAGQRVAHRVLLIAIALLAWAGMARPDWLSALHRLRWPGSTGRVLALAGIVLAALCFAGSLWDSVSPLQLAVTLLLAGFAVIGRVRRHGKTNSALLAACVALLAATTLPGFLYPADLSGYKLDEVVSIQSHFASSVVVGERLAAGSALFAEVNPPLGVLLPVLAAGWQLHVAPLELGDYQKLFRVFNLAYLLLVFLLFRSYAYRHYGIVLLAFLLVLPWLHFNHVCLNFPNQSAWRNLGFAAAPACLWALRRAPEDSLALYLGMLAGGLILFNPETGIALTAGLGAFVLFRVAPWSVTKGARLAVRALAGGAAAFLLWLVVHRALLRTWPALHEMATMFRNLEAFLQGYGGQPMAFEPFALWMFAHAAAVILWTAWHRYGRTGPRQAFRGAVAVTIVVWFGYWINRPLSWNLWTLISLYGVLAIDLLVFVRASLLRTRGGWPLVASATGLVGVVFPALLLSTTTAADELRSGFERAVSGSRTRPAQAVSAVLLRPDVAAELDRKGAVVRERARIGPTVYITAAPLLLSKVSGAHSDLPFSDPFNEIYTRKQYDELIARLCRIRQAELLMDDPRGLLVGGPTQRAYFRKLRRDLGKCFELGAVADGWEIWQRRENRAGTGS